MASPNPKKTHSPFLWAIFGFYLIRPILISMIEMLSQRYAGKNHRTVKKIGEIFNNTFEGLVNQINFDAIILVAECDYYHFNVDQAASMVVAPPSEAARYIINLLAVRNSA